MQDMTVPPFIIYHSFKRVAHRAVLPILIVFSRLLSTVSLERLQADKRTTINSSKIERLEEGSPPHLPPLACDRRSEAFG